MEVIALRRPAPAATLASIPTAENTADDITMWLLPATRSTALSAETPDTTRAAGTLRGAPSASNIRHVLKASLAHMITVRVAAPAMVLRFVRSEPAATDATKESRKQDNLPVNLLPSFPGNVRSMILY